MKITTVTMTGADDSILPESLFPLSLKYPFVEWGILLSRKSMGHNRFPGLSWLNELQLRNVVNYDFNVNFSGHLCGGFVREILMGETSFVNEIGSAWELFQRVQINTHGIQHNFHRVKLLNALAQYPEKEFIFQYDNANRELLDHVFLNSEINFSVLFDLSHGAGVLPGEWPFPISGISCGYAGGLSPDNIAHEIRQIEMKAGNSEIWIDMETKIRSDDDWKFDLKKVEVVLQIAQDYVQ